MPLDDKADGTYSNEILVPHSEPGQVILSQKGRANWLLADRLAGTLVTELHSFWDGWELRSDVVITDNYWHRVRLIWDGSERILFVDGIQVAVDAPPALMSSEAGLHIGAGKGIEAGSFWSGLIDDVGIYARVVRP